MTITLTREKDTRVSIAFNSFLRGTIGGATQLGELIL